LVEKTQTEKMFDLLVSGVSPAKVREKYPRRGATLTKALQKYIDWALPRIRELQIKGDPLALQAKTLEDYIRLKNNQITELSNSILKKREELQNLQHDLEKNEVEIKERQKALKNLTELTDKGGSL
jgi:predicted  nucleic acid-binding Zn-ribbon protein